MSGDLVPKLQLGNAPVPEALLRRRDHGASLPCLHPHEAELRRLRSLEVIHTALRMLSCAERAGARAATLARWARTDWGGPPRVHLDAGEAVGDWLLLEDDLDFAPHLRAALAAWLPLREPRCMLATLYNPCLPAADFSSHEPGKDGRDGKNGNEGEATWFCTAAETFTGAQALLVWPADAARALAAWETDGGMQSARRARLLTAEGGRICVHRPSLVQHVAADSARLHTAPDFAGE